MAEERNLALARAAETDDASDMSKEELQRRMDEARESISQTVTEIKETVVNQYQQVRETISDTLDWREQFRRHTVPFTIGAVGVGAILGYSVGGAVFGGNENEDYYEDEDEDYDYETDLPITGAYPSKPKRSYAAQPVLGMASAGPSSAQQQPQQPTQQQKRSMNAAFAFSGPSDDAGSSYSADESEDYYSSEAEEEAKPGLLERFKETSVYDRLQQELSVLGDRVIEELSTTARSVVVPALLSKVKDMIGIDLSTQREVAQRSKLEQQATKSNAANAEAAAGGGGRL